MHTFIKWLNKKRRSSDKEKHKTAIAIATILTLAAVYFVAYSWYGRLLNITNPKTLNEDSLGSVENQNIEEMRKETFLEKAKTQIKNLFENKQVVE